MGCNCGGGGSQEADSTAKAALKQGFRVFWPDQAPFPPGAPWLGAVVTRVEAYDLAVRFSTQFPGMEQGSFAAYSGLVSALLYSDGAEYAKERKKKKSDPPTRTIYQKCFEAACLECGGCSNVYDLNYDPNTGWCSYRCGDRTTTGSDFDTMSTSTSDGF